MLVGELDVAFALEQHAEQVVGGDAALQHHPVHQEHRHLHFGVAHFAEEYVLQPNAQDTKVMVELFKRAKSVYFDLDRKILIPNNIPLG